MPKKYRLDMTPEQAKITEKALELYARLKMGQWGELADLCLDLNDPDYAYKKFDVLQPGLMQLRSVAYPSLHGIGHSFGVGSFKDADLAWEVHETIRHRIAWTEHPEGGLGVDFDTPRSFRGNELAECTVIPPDEKGEES